MRIGMIGAGAIGSVFGADLYASWPDDFFVIAAGARAERIAREGLVVNGEIYPARVEQPAHGVKPAEIIFVCVKNYGLDSAIADMAPFVGVNTVIVPLLNGI